MSGAVGLFEFLAMLEATEATAATHNAIVNVNRVFLISPSIWFVVLVQGPLHAMQCSLPLSVRQSKFRLLFSDFKLDYSAFLEPLKGKLKGILVFSL